MRTRIRLLLYALLLCGATGGARAQTFYGPDGLFVHPTAYTPPARSLTLYAAWFTQSAGTSRVEWIPANLTYGVTDRLAVGGVFFAHGGGSVERHIHGGAFAKYQLSPDGPNRPAVALAAGFLSADERQNQAAGVVSHRFARGDRTLLTAHLGALWVRAPHGDGEDTSLFAGAALPLGHGFSLVGEAGTRLKFESHGSSAIGIAWEAGRGLDLAIGYVNAGRSDDSRFFIGIGFPVGGGR